MTLPGLLSGVIVRCGRSEENVTDAWNHNVVEDSEYISHGRHESSGIPPSSELTHCRHLMVYLQLQVRLRWSDTPPSCGTPIQDATSVDSAMLIMAAHSARTFKNSAPVGDNSWHDCIAWCNIPEPAPPAYATHNFVTEKPGYPVFSRRYGVQPQPHAATTLGKGETHIPCHHMSTEPAAPSHQGHQHAHCTTDRGKDVNGMNDDDDDGEDGQPCRFGRPCGVMLTDFSEDGLNRHLAQYHLQDLQDSIVRTP